VAIVSVNRQVIGSNAKLAQTNPQDAEYAPVIRIAKNERAGAHAYGSEVAICDANGNEVARFRYNAENAIAKCGARLVLDTKFEPRVIR
jgi:hypothetical protein